MEQNEIYKFSLAIEKIHRSIASPGNLKTLKIIKKHNKKLKILNFPTGKKYLTGKYQKFGQLKMLG